MKSSSLALVTLASIAAVSAVAHAETITIKPNWEDPKLKEAMAQVKSVREMGLSSAFNLPGEPLPVAIPVLGMAIPDAVSSGTEEESAVYGYEKDRRSRWYSQQYTAKDGSLSIVVYGNSVVDSEGTTVDLPKDTDPPDVQFLTADGDDQPSEVRATFVRFGIPYSVTITCEEPGQKTCTEAQAVNELVENLQVLGGNP